MRLSVIIPTLNRPHFIVSTVESVFNGKYQNFELIVVDQSGDNSTYEALADYRSDSRFRYIRASHPGASAARNRGLIASSGEVIVFTDDDVVAKPDWLELISNEFTADADLQFVCGSLVAPPYNADHGFIPEFRPPPVIPTWKLPLIASNANLSMRRRLFDQIGGYDELCGPGGLLRSSDDGDITLRMVRSGAKWKSCPTIEVIHLHGFRSNASSTHLLDDYDYGNGAIYGRAMRRGDMVAGIWFILYEIRMFAKQLFDQHPDKRSHIARKLRWQGFWHGLRLPPQQGFLSAHGLQQKVSKYTQCTRDLHWLIMVGVLCDMLHALL